MSNFSNSIQQNRDQVTQEVKLRTINELERFSARSRIIGGEVIFFLTIQPQNILIIGNIFIPKNVASSEIGGF